MSMADEFNRVPVFTDKKIKADKPKRAGRQRLSDIKIAQIRGMRAMGYKISAIATAHNTSISVVHKYCRGIKK